MFFCAGILFLKKFPVQSETNYEYLYHKIAPIVTLILIAAVNGGLSCRFQSTYARRVLYSLVLSCIGDWFICFKETEMLAAIIFGLAHCFYITTFGFKTLKLPIGIVNLLVVVGFAYYLVPFVSVYEEKLLVPIYFGLLLTMIWRALAKINLDYIQAPQLIAGLGAILFGISDMVLCYDQFVSKLAYGNFWILITYYLAQFGIAASTINSEKSLELNSACLFSSKSKTFLKKK